MTPFLPHPILSGLLVLLWLLLQQSAGLGHLLLGVAIAVAVPLAAHSVIPGTLTPRRPLKLLQLLLVAGADIVRSNITVFWVLVHPRLEPTAGFIEMELELTNEFGLALLACILTATPGSAWLEYDRQRSTVLIHVFDLIDADAWVATIKTRYESLLLEVFP